MHTGRFARYVLILISTLGFAAHASAQSPDPNPAPTVELRQQLQGLQKELEEQQKQLMKELPDLQLNLRKELWDLRDFEWTVPRFSQKPRVRVPRDPSNTVESTEPFARTFKVGSDAALLVVNVRGNIVVSAGSGDQIDAKATKHAWGSNDEDAKRRLANTVIEVYTTGNRVELRAEPNARFDSGNIEVEFDIKVPPDCSVDLRSVSGDVRVTNVKGELRSQTVSGNLTLEATSKIAVGRTVSGDIQITNGGGDASTVLATVSGDLTVQGLTARSLDFNTISGDFLITNWAGERVSIRSLSGDIELSGSLAKGGRYDVESHSGDVRLAVADQPGFELEANTFSGRIRVDFSIKSEGPVRDQDRGPRSVRGTFAEGSASVRVQTFTGNITVTRRN
jgi:hypothetical protein